LHAVNAAGPGTGRGARPRLATLPILCNALQVTVVFLASLMLLHEASPGTLAEQAAGVAAASTFDEAPGARAPG
jgi:hypothetical protein